MTRVESPGNHHRLRVWLGSPSKLQNLLKTQFPHLQDKMFPLGVGGRLSSVRESTLWAALLRGLCTCCSLFWRHYSPQSTPAQAPPPD